MPDVQAMTVIRYMAATDDTPWGRTAYGYLLSLLKIAPVRLCTLSGGLDAQWQRCYPMFATPFGQRFVNVVCCAPSRWTWSSSIPIPTRQPDNSLKMAGEVARGVVELYTAGVRNVLLTHVSFRDGDLTPQQVTAALRYEVIVVATDDARQNLAKIRPPEAPVFVVPVPVAPQHIDALTQAILR